MTLEREEKGIKLPTYILLNTKAKGQGFINKGQAKDQILEPIPLVDLITLYIFNRRELENRKITYYIQIDIRIKDYFKKDVRFYIIQLAYYPIILGIPQIKIYNPLI